MFIHSRGLPKLLSVFLLFFLTGFIAKSQELSTVYLCITDDTTMNIMAISAVEPLGFIFSRTVNVFVYAPPEQAIVADVIHISPDTHSGTYRRSGEIIVNSASANTSLPQQVNSELGSCENRYPELNGLERTILLPLSRDQALVVHLAERVIDYYNTSPDFDLIIGVIGFFFHNPTLGNFPHFQILRLSGGADDTVSISFPELTEPADFYVLARDIISYTNTTVQGRETQSKYMDDIEIFFDTLNLTETDSLTTLMDTIMGPANFRFFPEFGEIMQYLPGRTINIARLAANNAREFVEGAIIQSFSCRVPVPYFREEGYSDNWYLNFNDRNSQVVSHISCERIFAIGEVLLDGRLVIYDGDTRYVVASWLVRLVIKE